MTDREKLCDEYYPDCKNCYWPIWPICKLVKESSKES